MMSSPFLTVPRLVLIIRTCAYRRIQSVDASLHTFAVRREVGSHASWTPSEFHFIFSALSTSLHTGALEHRHLLWQMRRATENHRPSVSIFRLDVASATNRIRAGKVGL